MAYQYRGTKSDLACGDKVGTLAGRQRHHRAGEALCDYCKAAHNEYNREWRVAHKGSNSARTAIANRIRQRAFIKLKDMYPDDYERLKTAEWIAETNREIGES